MFLRIIAILFICYLGSDILRCQCPEKVNIATSDQINIIHINGDILKYGSYANLKDRMSQSLLNEKELINRLINRSTITSKKKISIDDIISLNAAKTEEGSSAGDIILQTVLFIGITASVVLLWLNFSTP